MDKFLVTAHFERIKAAQEEWDLALLRFQADVDTLVSRLLYEALIQRMSVEQISAASGIAPRRVREMIRHKGLKASTSKGILSRQAADALHENAALLGIEPHEFDLTSPLAYLPMGEQMRKELEKDDE